EDRTFDGHDFADLVHTEFSLATHDEIRNIAAFLELGLWPHLIGDAEPLEQLVDVDSTRAAARRIDIGNRFGGKQRILEGPDRPDVGHRGAFLDHNTDRDGCQINPAVRDDFAGSGQAIDDYRRDDRHIEGFAGFNSLLQAARSVVVDDDLVARLILEIRHQPEHNLLEGTGGQNLDLSRAT